MLEYITDFRWNSLLGILMYWVPLLFCVYGYLLRTHRNVQKDKRERENGSYYMPTDKMGTLIGRGILAILPVGNLFAAIFDLGPEVFGRFFRRLEQLFDIPLVPDTDAAKAKREQKKNSKIN